MSPDSAEIITMLREASLGWIADELVESLALGRQTFKDFREPGASRTTRATTVEPLSPQEEMKLVVGTLAQYFLVIPKAWKSARRQLSGGDTPSRASLVAPASTPADATVNGFPHRFAADIGIAAGGGGEVFHDFSDDYQKDIAPKFHGILRELWPAGVEDFDGRFSLGEDNQ